MKSARKSLRKRWSESRKPVKKIVGKGSVLKSSVNTIRNPTSNPKSSKNPLKLKRKSEDCWNNQSSSKIWMSKTCNVSSRQLNNYELLLETQLSLKVKKVMLYMSLLKDNTTAPKSSTGNQHILRLTQLGKPSVSSHWCTTRQEPPRLSAKQQVSSSNWTDKPSKTSSNRLLLKKENTTAKFFQKLIFFQKWIHMKEIRFVMPWEKKLLGLRNMSWDKANKVTNSTLLLKVSSLLRRKKAPASVEKSSSTNKAIISVKSLWLKTHQDKPVSRPSQHAD